MKIFNIPVGTVGYLIDQSDGQFITKSWSTRKPLSYTDVIIDPIMYHNHRGALNLPSNIEQLAQRGYAVYGGADGNDHTARYLLAVEYSDVVVSNIPTWW